MKKGELVLGVARKYSKWRSVMELWTLFSNTWAVGPYTAQCFWDWAYLGAGQSERGTWHCMT